MRFPFSTLPDPEDKHPAPLRPFVRKEGVYTFFREPMDTEVLYVEPDGQSYSLEWFETERIFRTLLRLNEIDSNTILDRLWTFHKVEVDLDQPAIVRILR